MDPIIWIVIGVVALVVVIALIAVATKNSSRKKLGEAAELRKDAREREQQLERQHSVAREQEHRAGAAEQEAQAKAAEADRFRAEAEQHRSVLDEQRQDVRRMEEHADKLDPKHRADAPGRDAGPDRAVDRDPVGQHDSRTGARTDARTVGRTDGLGVATPTGAADSDTPGRHSRAEDLHGLDEGPAGRHPQDVDPAAHPENEPGIVDKMTGRTGRDDRGR
ncbi:MULTISPECIES: hypothetical protein [unclassified Dietzia]|uniref:hypothetical protein n=1 Tax=unclassified Dietzia TaxID=2617939 RepID=UPI000D21BFBE|nr:MULTISPECIES: hypothetical protein [unclassified Dietzia]AVZ39743.1 hypothetical protein CT688_09965 [Dietzia sp. JS16-p6b]QGW25085.1 hypothetical protein GJR88_03176 [Dietzia sp. DQ12-45-1b]